MVKTSSIHHFSFLPALGFAQILFIKAIFRGGLIKIYYLCAHEKNFSHGHQAHRHAALIANGFQMMGAMLSNPYAAMGGYPQQPMQQPWGMPQAPIQQAPMQQPMQPWGYPQQPMMQNPLMYGQPAAAPAPAPAVPVAPAAPVEGTEVTQQKQFNV